MMNLRWIMVCFLSLATPVLAEDVSPWFGSEASKAQQISLEKQSQLTTQSTQQATLDKPVDCTVEGCPPATAPAK
jgi:coenzyme F420-reducing hydrogenase gamma subunit